MPPSLLMDTLEIVFQMVADWGVSPVIAGGLAVSYWGHPRSTRDIEVLLDLQRGQLNLEYLQTKSQEIGLDSSRWIVPL